MKRLIGVFLCAAAVAGTLALAAPAAPLAPGNGHNCKSKRRCLYEEGTTCPPCFELKRCAPDCGCVAIPGCLL
jgi:hypothetical protein